MAQPDPDRLVAAWFRYLVGACLLFPIVVLLLIYL
jgi:hypothetical protein